MYLSLSLSLSLSLHWATRIWTNFVKILGAQGEATAEGKNTVFVRAFLKCYH